MCASAAKSNGSVLLFDVSWKTYQKLIDALPQRIRHTYQQGTFELFGSLVHSVPWESYGRILSALGDRRFPHTYQEGTLEILMSPSERHEQIKSFLGRLIEIAALELGIRFKAVGSATQRDKKLLHGLEPDESYYIPYAAQRGKTAHVSQQKSTPDLAIEVELRKGDLERMTSYAKLGIHELWRYRKGRVEFFCLSADGTYELAQHSHAFPLIGSKDVTRFLKKLQMTDDYSATRAFVAWLRKRREKK